MKNIKSRIKKREKEIIKFTQELIRTPSQNGMDSEERIAKLVFDKLMKFGFSPKIIGSRKHPSVICFIKKKNPKKTIWLESCLDTVPAGDLRKWEVNPFEGKILGNKLYGRGAADSKIGIALFSYLAKELSEDSSFQGNIFLGFDANEQSGVFSGMKEIIKFVPRANVCILGYQSRKEISIGARGWLRIKLITFGMSAHTGSRHHKGINAIHKAIEALSKVLKIKFKEQKNKLFKYGNSINIVSIRGGVAINVVPDKCEAIIDIRITPPENYISVFRKLDKRLKIIQKNSKGFKYQMRIIQKMNPFVSNPNYPFLKTLARNAKKILKENIPLTTMGAGSVGNLISQKRNIAIVNSFGVRCGNIHAPNEWVDILDIQKIFQIYKDSLIEFVDK